MERGHTVPPHSSLLHQYWLALHTGLLAPTSLQRKEVKDADKKRRRSEMKGAQQPDSNNIMITQRHDQREIRQLMETARGRPAQRRCFSGAETSERARTWFSSPDRFLSPRAESVERECVFRVSKSPYSLSPGERHSRQRDHNADPFHNTSSSRSRDAIRIRRSSASERQPPPHFTPSFLHGHDASPGPIDTNEPSTTPRQISVGAVWSVGGPTVAQGGPRPGVHNGHGGLLASGTNGPMHTAHFLDRNNSSQDIQQHENRLALALDIDQASRVLGSVPRPPLIKPTSGDAAQRRPITWRNNAWATEEGADRKLRWLLLKINLLTLCSRSKEMQQESRSTCSNPSVQSPRCSKTP